jgi:AAHS family 4-hydroxybenzoate transporter-like MFS transporter
MAEVSLSAAEAALENQRLGALQIRVAALCTLVQICDGYDIGSIGIAVPALTHAWNLPGPAFTQAFLWSSIGIMVGALSAGPIGDRVGRKPLLVASLTIFGLASLLSATAGSLLMLSILRFFTGMGIGGAFPGAATLTGDYAPQRLRATMIMATFTGAPLGGFVVGQAGALLLARFGWPSVFVLGGLMPLLAVPVLLFWLPESPRFLAAKQALSPRQAALLQRLGLAPGQAAEGLDLARGNPVKMLFGKGYALQTVLLWVIFFCSLMDLFLFGYWLPEVLHLTGMTPSQAARAASYRALGAMFAVLYLGLLIDRFGPQRALAWHYAAGAVFTALISLLAMPYGLLVAVIFLSGLTTTGSQTGANATCGKLYPARMRTSGLGWALGIGRLGGITAPPLGGWLLSLGLPPRQIFLSACGFALVAAVATALLALRAPEAAALSASVPPVALNRLARRS